MPKVRRHARPSCPVDFYVDEIDKEMCKAMVVENHYSGKCPGLRYAYGLFERGMLVGAVAYSQPASYTLCKGVCGLEYKALVVELARLVVVTRTNNAASYLISNSLSTMPDHVVVSYADCNDHIGHVGYVYQATNWLYTGHGNAEPVWVDPRSGKVVAYTRRHIDDKARAIGLDWRQLTRVKQLGKHRYVTFTGSKSFKRTARVALRYSVLPYPKGSTRRHDCVAHGDTLLEADGSDAVV